MSLLAYERAGGQVGRWAGGQVGRKFSEEQLISLLLSQ